MIKLRQSILKVLAYFDLFQYPLEKEEILFFLDQQASPEELGNALALLMKEGHIYRQSTFYALQAGDALAKRRKKGNEHAGLLLPIGKKISTFLFRFPFVRGIGISGSLSKNCAAEDADIDYFIITKTNRLWIARTFLHLFKKFSFLAGREHWYCMNYFVDEEALVIEEKNIFTAVELITLLPVCGNGAMEKFFNANDWATGYFPRYQQKTSSHKTPAPKSLMKRVVEYFLDNRAGDWLDRALMKITAKRWMKKEQEKKISSKGTRMGLRASRHFSKPNPDFFQADILTRYLNRLNEVSSRFAPRNKKVEVTGE